MLLIALVFSLVPALASPTSAFAATCDQAQFVADVTVPDGSVFDANATFKKTWRLKNIGTCTWTTSYSLVFDTGSQMGAPASIKFPSNVAPGQTVDLTVDMTAPGSAGHYIGYWKFKNASNVLFGIGSAANKSWWVEINVKGSSGLNVVYDFTANASSATWSNGAGNVSFPGTDGDSGGFGIKKDKPKFETGVEASEPGLLMSPRNITNGYIQATYPAFAVQSGDRFHTTVGCEYGATSCYVAYRLDYEIDGVTKTYWTFRERYEGLTFIASIDLTPLAGKNVKFTLVINAYGSPTGDRALWGNPAIIRQGSVATATPGVTGTPPTATPSKTPAPTTPTVPPSSCDKVQFVADVNVPDGTTFAPGAPFTKTWRLKNVGTCAWSTSYQLVFFSGEKMGAASSANFPQNVAVGQTVDISINMTAPSAAGSYRGFWMFKNTNGALFGIGTQGNKPWWVDIKVSGATVTPGGATSTPSPTSTTGPTATATVAVTATTTATTNPTSGWNKYQNTKYGFEFKYPTGSSVSNQTDNGGRVTLPIITGGTNLSEKYLNVSVVEGANPCKAPDPGGPIATTETVTINGIQFLKESGGSGAAGSQYDFVAYSSLSNNACVSLTFILHSTNIGNYETPPPAFDKAAESAIFDQIMNTYDWTG